MSDITLAVGDGARRMTYAELADARRISLAAARRLTLRHHWPKQMGNDGLIRVSVPLSALEKPRKSAIEHEPTSDSTSSMGSPASDTVSDTTRAIRALEGAVEGLREQLIVANQRAERAERRADELQATLDLLRVPSAPPRRSWWRWQRKLGIAAVMWFAACEPALAMRTGNELLAECLNLENLFERGSCIGYVTGFTEVLYQYMTDTCIPKKVTYGQLVDVSVRYLQAHPEKKTPHGYYPGADCCTARSFWDTELKPTLPERAFEAATGEIGLA